VLLLHGVYAGAGAHEWARLVPLLAAHRTVRNADLLGFGASDRPAMQFTPDVLIAAVEALVADLGAGGTVVASSLTGAYALRAVARSDEPPDLVLVTPTGFGAAQARPSRVAPLLEALGRRTPIGDALTRALVSRTSVRWFLQHQVYADAAQATDEVVRQHEDAGRHRNAKYPLVAFVAGSLALPVDRSDVERVRPLVVWGDAQRFSEPGAADEWSAAGATVIHRSSGMPHVEEPEAFADILLRSA
jgi:hypothetical protein